MWLWLISHVRSRQRGSSCAAIAWFGRPGPDSAALRTGAAAAHDHRSSGAVDRARAGLKFGFGVSYSKTEPGYTLEDFDIEGKAWTYTARVSYPVIRSRTMNWYLRGLGVYRDVENENGLAEFTTKDHLWVARIGTTFDVVDRFGGVTLFDFEMSKGLPIFNYTKRGELSSRPEGTGDFFKINGQVAEPVHPWIQPLRRCTGSVVGQQTAVF